jgi:hypothetical protein
MNKLIFTIATLLFALFSTSLSAQNIAAKRGQLAVGQNSVRIVEQSDVQQAVRTIEQRTKKTKVNGYTILILSDNSHTARENANKAKETFEENFPETKVKMFYESPSFYVTAGSYLTKEEAIIEMMRFRSVFPKAITQNREMDIEDFIADPAEQGNEEKEE